MNDLINKITSLLGDSDILFAFIACCIGLSAKASISLISDWYPQFKKSGFNIRMKSSHESVVFKNVKPENVSATLIRGKQEIERTEMAARIHD